MRRRILTLLLAALAVVIAVPFGAAWSFSDRKATFARPALMESVVLPAQPLSIHGSEAMTLLLAGTVLIGLSLAMRRSR